MVKHVVVIGYGPAGVPTPRPQPTPTRKGQNPLAGDLDLQAIRYFTEMCSGSEEGS